MATETTQPAPVRFRRLAPGLYGTGINTSAEYARRCGDYMCDYDRAEIVVDHYTDSQYGWTIRYVCACGSHTPALGEWFATLAEARQHVTHWGDRA